MRTSPSSRRRWTARTATVVLAAVLGVAVVAPPASASSDPAFQTPQATLDAALRCPATFSHPSREPVLLVHGTGMTYEEAWSWGYADALTSMGYDVCGVELPSYGLTDMQVSSEYVANAILRINQATGHKVDVVGHSQGNLEIRWAVKYWTAAQAVVDDVVMLGSPSHGGLPANGMCVLSLCNPAAWQMSAGSDFLAALNSGDETPGSISYTSVYSRTDEVIVPWTTAVTQGAQNIAIQDVCPLRTVLHVGLLYDAVAFRLTLDALSHAGPAQPSRIPFTTCLSAVAPGVTAADITVLNGVVGPLIAARIALAPMTLREPALQPYAF